MATVTLFVALQFWSASIVRSAPQGSPKKTQPTKMPPGRASPCSPRAPHADVTKLAEASRNKNRHEALLDYAQRFTNEGSYPEANPNGASSNGTAWAVTESRMVDSAPAYSAPQAGLTAAMAMAPAFSPADAISQLQDFLFDLASGKQHARG